MQVLLLLLAHALGRMVHVKQPGKIGEARFLTNGLELQTDPPEDHKNFRQDYNGKLYRFRVGTSYLAMNEKGKLVKIDGNEHFKELDEKERMKMLADGMVGDDADDEEYEPVTKRRKSESDAARKPAVRKRRSNSDPGQGPANKGRKQENAGPGGSGAEKTNTGSSDAVAREAQTNGDSPHAEEAKEDASQEDKEQEGGSKAGGNFEPIQDKGEQGSSLKTGDAGQQTKLLDSLQQLIDQEKGKHAKKGSSSALSKKAKGRSNLVEESGDPELNLEEGGAAGAQYTSSGLLPLQSFAPNSGGLLDGAAEDAQDAADTAGGTSFITKAANLLQSSGLFGNGVNRSALAATAADKGSDVGFLFEIMYVGKTDADQSVLIIIDNRCLKSDLKFHFCPYEDRWDLDPGFYWNILATEDLDLLNKLDNLVKKKRAKEICHRSQGSMAVPKCAKIPLPREPDLEPCKPAPYEHCEEVCGPGSGANPSSGVAPHGPQPNVALPGCATKAALPNETTCTQPNAGIAQQMAGQQHPAQPAVVVTMPGNGSSTPVQPTALAQGIFGMHKTQPMVRAQG
ncbi:hypothetical protein PAPHI01_2514 [Pancytospora philotis]|nr:hypothetical protein PAPHI01_1694 [Pancytospora philotis]KAI4293240.1 hypothetical protein PAPHI01_2514 [Pancytospora philotis]